MSNRAEVVARSTIAPQEIEEMASGVSYNEVEVSLTQEQIAAAQTYPEAIGVGEDAAVIYLPQTEKEGDEPAASSVAIEQEEPIARRRSVTTDSRPVTRGGYSGLLRRPISEKSDGSEDDILRIYLQQIGNYPLLTKDEEVQLSKRVMAGNEAKDKYEQIFQDASEEELAALQATIDTGHAAKLDFTNSNLRLVVSIAKRFQNRGLSLLDLIEEGNLGMMHAVDKFDWHKGFKFSTYATWWIRQAIDRGIKNSGRTIRVTVAALDEHSQISKYRLLGESVSDMQERLELTGDQIKRWQHINTIEPVSLDAPLEPGERVETDLGDMIADPKSSEGYELVETSTHTEGLTAALSGLLSEQEARVIIERFGLLSGTPKKLQEIALPMNVQKEWVRQIESMAINKLRHPVMFKKLVKVIPLICDDDEWKLGANCSDAEAEDIFGVFIGRGRKAKNGMSQQEEFIKEKLMICNGCPVKEQCQQLANQIKPRQGIWAGKLAITSRKVF